MISVVVLAKDATPAIVRRSLESVRSQVYPPSEWFLLDHGARAPAFGNDGDGRVLPSNQYIVCPGLSGAQARNVGLHLGSAPYLLFLDATDELMPMALGHFERAIRRRPVADLLLGRSLVRSSGGSIRANSVEPRSPETLVVRVFLGRIEASSSAIVARRRALEELDGFDEAWSSHETLDLILRMARSHVIAEVPEDVAIVLGAADASAPIGLSTYCRLLGRHAHRLAQVVGKRPIRARLGDSELRAAVAAWHTDPDRAERHLRRARRLMPGQPLVWLPLGWLRARPRLALPTRAA